MRNVYLVPVLGIMLLLALAFAAGIALGYPEQAVRLGYNGCQSCHVSPTGGGALTNYGRAAAQDMATWPSYDDSKLLPDWLAVGGDSRSVAVKTKGYSQAFNMQADCEVAVQVAPGAWLDASAGVYGPEHKREYRRSYVLAAPTPNVTVRAGRFLPAYGIMEPDHTTATRRGVGFDEGTETLNGELTVHGTYGELALTDTFGGDEQMTTSADSGYRVRADQPGFAGRATAYVARSLDAGASYWYHTSPMHDTLAAGPFVTWAPTQKLYLLAEADRVSVDAQHTDVSWTMVGYEALPGVHVRLSHEYDNGSRYGAGLQLLPVAHTELLAQAKWQGGLWTTLLMGHWSW